MLQSIARWVLQKIILNVAMVLAKYLPAYFEDIKKKQQRAVEQEKAKQELEQELKKELTPEEKAKAYAKYQNSGR